MLCVYDLQEHSSLPGTSQGSQGLGYIYIYMLQVTKLIVGIATSDTSFVIQPVSKPGKKLYPVREKRDTNHKDSAQEMNQR